MLEKKPRTSFLEVFNSLTFILGNKPHPPPWSAILDEGLKKVSLWQFELLHFYFTTSLQVRAATWRSQLYYLSQLNFHIMILVYHRCGHQGRFCMQWTWGVRKSAVWDGVVHLHCECYGCHYGSAWLFRPPPAGCT